jgi:hypothetical protein
MIILLLATVETNYLPILPHNGPPSILSQVRAEWDRRVRLVHDFLWTGRV